MATRFSVRDANQETLYELQRIARLLGVLATREAKTQKDGIALLSQMGFSAMEIAAILNTTPNTVNVALHQIRRAPRTKTKRKAKVN